MPITPGPWELLPGEHDVINEAGLLIATVYPGGYTRDSDLNEARRRANARAIAEVPALIAILRDVIIAHSDPDSPASDLLWELAIRDARAALARIDKED